MGGGKGSDDDADGDEQPSKLEVGQKEVKCWP